MHPYKSSTSQTTGSHYISPQITMRETPVSRTGLRPATLREKTPGGGIFGREALNHHHPQRMEKRSITISLHVETRSTAITPTTWKSLQSPSAYTWKSVQSPSPPGRGREEEGGQEAQKKKRKKEEAYREKTRSEEGRSLLSKRGGGQGQGRRGGRRRRVGGREEGGQFLPLESFCSWAVCFYSWAVSAVGQFLQL